jgi:lysozyme
MAYKFMVKATKTRAKLEIKSQATSQAHKAKAVRMIPWTDKLTMTEKLIVHHEGFRLKPYVDTEGKLTVGVGRNLTDKGLSKDEALQMLRNDLAEFEEALSIQFIWFKSLSEVRKMVMVSMAFNLGMKGLFTFKKFLAAMANGNWVQAGHEMLDSKWALQVGQRSKDLSIMILTDDFPAGLSKVFQGFEDAGRDPLI